MTPGFWHRKIGRRESLMISHQRLFIGRVPTALRPLHRTPISGFISRKVDHLRLKRLAFSILSIFLLRNLHDQVSKDTSIVVCCDNESLLNLLHRESRVSMC